MVNLAGKPLSEIVGHTYWESLLNVPEPIPKCPCIRMQNSFRRESLLIPLNDRLFEVNADPILDDSGKLIDVI